MDVICEWPLINCAIEFHPSQMVLRGMGMEAEVKELQERQEERERRDAEGGWALLRQKLKKRKVSARARC